MTDSEAEVLTAMCVGFLIRKGVYSDAVFCPVSRDWKVHTKKSRKRMSALKIVEKAVKHGFNLEEEAKILSQ